MSKRIVLMSLKEQGEMVEFSYHRSGRGNGEVSCKK